MRVQITDHSVGWIEREVQAWLAQRVATRPIQAASSLGQLTPVEFKQQLLTTDPNTAVSKGV
jgi:hypothetical protein